MNRSRPTLQRTFAFLAAVVLSSASATAQLPGASGEQIIYDNSTTFLDRSLSLGNAVEFGDEVFFEPGVNRFLTDFQFQYFGSADLLSGSGEIFIRLNDGPQVGEVNGNPILAPGTVLFQSGAFPLAPGYQTVEMDLSADPVALLETNGSFANNVTWSVVFDNVNAGATAGLTIFDPPTVGDSFDDYWRKTGNDWDTFIIDNGALPANFSARLTAVPEPSTYLYALMAGLGFAGFLRFRRR